MAITEVEVLQIDTSKSTKSIAELRREVKELKGQLLELDEGSKEYNDTLVEVADKQHQLVEITEQVNASSTDFGDRMANVAGTIGGLSGAVQTVTGTLSLMGVEMGDDAKLMKTLVAAMSVTSGVQAIDAGIKSVKALTISLKASITAAGGLGKALKAFALSNPFTAILAAAVAVVAVFVKIKNAISDAADETERYKEANEALSYSLKRLDQNTEFDIGLMQVQGKTSAEIAAARKNAALAAYNEAKSTYDLIAAKKDLNETELQELETARQVVNQRYDAWRAAKDAYIIAQEQEKADRRRAAQQRAAAAAAAAAAQRKADLDRIAQLNRAAEIALMDEEVAELTKLDDAYKENLKLYEKRKKDTSTLTAQYEAERLAIVEKYQQEEQEKVQAAADEAKERFIANSAEQLTLLEKQLAMEQEVYDRMQITSNNKLAGDYAPEKVEEAEQMMENAYTALLAKKIELEQQMLESEALTAEDRQTIQDNLLAHQMEQAERSVEIERKALDKRKTLYSNYQKAVQSITGSISSILGTIGGTLEEGSRAWKIIKIAETTISTIQGGIDAYMGMVRTIPGPAGMIAGATAAAATVAAGMAEVAKIRSTNISASGSGSATTSTTTALGSVKAAAVQVASTEVTNTRQTYTTSDIEQLPDTRVYVLESDITNAQRNVKTTVKQATF